jgi:hypothetical protein
MGMGGEGASMTSRMLFGGWLYPDSSASAAGAEVAPEEDELDCARTVTDVAQAKSGPTRRQIKVFRAGISSLRFNALKQHLSGTG